MIKLVKVDKNNIKELQSLAFEAKEEGYRFVQRTIDEWLNKKNDFSKKGEVFYGIKSNNVFVSVGGLNVDPYVKGERIGRIRHVYTKKEHRQMGYSSMILKVILKDAITHFDKIRLSSYNIIASYYYERYGFKRKIEYRATHIMNTKEDFDG